MITMPTENTSKTELDSKKEKFHKNLLIALSLVGVISLTLSSVVSYITIKNMQK